MAETPWTTVLGSLVAISAAQTNQSNENLPSLRGEPAPRLCLGSACTVFRWLRRGNGISASRGSVRKTDEDLGEYTLQRGVYYGCV